jgi:hypothetical protein
LQDKVTLKLFAATVDDGKLEAALELVNRLHLEKSYDLAIRLADRHDKLADMIEDAKERKFGYDEGGHSEARAHGNNFQVNNQGSKQTSFMNLLNSPSPQITPEPSHTQKRTVGQQSVSAIPKRHRFG